VADRELAVAVGTTQDLEQRQFHERAAYG
jgi:hypothetical protein